LSPTGPAVDADWSSVAGAPFVFVFSAAPWLCFYAPPGGAPWLCSYAPTEEPRWRGGRERAGSRWEGAVGREKKKGR
jgi:hypothetical protein